MTVPWRLIGMLALMLAGFGSAWQFREWRYAHQLAEQVRLQAETLNQLTQAAATAQQPEQGKWLAVSEQNQFRKMTDAQRDQDYLRDRLATSNLRLSAPAAWNMQPYESDLPRHMLNGLSSSPTPVTG